MASTNVNTDNQNVISTDIYEISGFIDQIRQETIPDLDNTSSIVGIFGYMNEIFSQTMQNALVVISESVNETIPTRAKFTKNIISHAMNIGITDICATPAVMTMMIYLPISYIESNFVSDINGKSKFILSRECPIMVGDYEYHLDYDIIITRTANTNKSDEKEKYTYTAMYDLFETGTTKVKQSNPISNITNPYITTLIKCVMDRTEFLAFSARLHQVSLSTVEKNILTNSPIENKAVTFEFDGQLAAFDLDIIENNKVTHLTPVYSGLLDYTIPDGSWCHYNYINENTIRILFSQDSYVPSMNAVVKINVQTSEGSSGNFTYNNNFKTSLKSETYNNYNGMYAYIYPLMDGMSTNGKDKKSINDIKKIIPREASSRGALINTTDLNNFFNSINDDECKLYFKKKKDNQFERMYYTYMLMKKEGYVYPTNTLNAKINQNNFKGFAGNNNLVIAPGTVFYYYNHGSDTENDFATLTSPVIEQLDKDIYPHDMTINADGDLVRVFKYTTPFLISIDDDLITSYMLTIMNDNKPFAFDSINTASDLQFVATNMNWKRKYFYKEYDEENDKEYEREYDNKYTMDIVMTQNDINKDYGLILHHIDENGNMIFDDIRIRVIMVLYSDETETSPYKYVEAELVEYDDKSYIYTFRFTVETDDLMDLNNRINISGIYNCKPEAFQHKNNAVDLLSDNDFQFSIEFESEHLINEFVKKYNLTDYEIESNILSVSIKANTPMIFESEQLANEFVKECALTNYKIKPNTSRLHGYMNKNTFAKIFILSDFGTKPGDEVEGVIVTEDTDEIILYSEDEKNNPGNRKEIEKIIPTRVDIVDSFLKNEIYLEKDGEQINVVTIIKDPSKIYTIDKGDGTTEDKLFIEMVKEYNGDKLETELAILKYLRNNKDLKADNKKHYDFIHDVLLKDEDVNTVIDSYHYEDLSRYTLCNVLNVDGGIDFYHDYSSMMRSTVAVKQIPLTDPDNKPIYKEIGRKDGLGKDYTEKIPLYLTNEDGTYVYNYDVKRIPLLRNDYLNTEELMQDFIFDLELRRKYIEECLYVLEDTFDIDLKFFNTYGPSKMFYYDIPSSQAYKVRVAVKNLKLLRNTEDEDGENAIIQWLHFGDQITINKVVGQWGRVTVGKDDEGKDTYGWVKLADTTRIISYIDNVSLTMNFALEANSSADKYISDDIIADIKSYVEDINTINELHIPNIITLITNNYREQLVYFEFLNVNNYGAACQHLYLDEKINADICPEFLNIDNKNGDSNISIAVY